MHILRHPEYLDPSYVPDELPFREPQIKELAEELRITVATRTASSLFLVGPPGTGKTAVARYVLRQANAEMPQITTICVNTWLYRTRYSLLSQISAQLGLPLPRRGVALDEILTRLFETFSKKEGVVLVLDEVDKLSQDGLEVLYELSRFKEFASSPFLLITISNTTDFLTSLDPRILSSIFHRSIEFTPYTVPQLKRIVLERARKALVPGTYDEEVIGLCAAMGWKRGGDARAAILLLFEAAKLAEIEGADAITVDHVKRASPPATLLGLPPKYAKIVELLKNGPLRVRELYERYVQEVGPLTLRAFRNYISDLVRMGVVEVERAHERGYVRIVKLKE